MILIGLTARHQAFHDMIISSVVVFKDPASVDNKEKLPERKSSLYPSIPRRLFFILLYSCIGLSIIGELSSEFLSASCKEQKQCDDKETLIIYPATIGWLVSVPVIIILGWNGRLWGCRRK